MPSTNKNNHEVSPEVTAWHEAGHAVMCVLLRVEFTSVSIVKDEESFGRVKHPARALRRLRIDDRGSPSVQDTLEKHIMIAMAGSMAELHQFNRSANVRRSPPRKYGKAFRSTGAAGKAGEYELPVNWKEKEMGVALDLANHYFDNNAAAVSACFRYLLQKTQSLLSYHGNWYAVRNVAEHLLLHKTLPAKVVREIVRQTLGGHAKSFRYSRQ